MSDQYSKLVAVLLCIVVVLSGCNSPKKAPVAGLPVKSTAAMTKTLAPTRLPDTATPEVKPRVLSICLGQEPKSLFYYADGSSAAQSVLQAVYDGPYDVRGFDYQPVILTDRPSIKNGGARLEAVQVKAGDMIVDAGGSWVNLAEGVKYRPSGCTGQDCIQTYTGSDPVKMDQLVVKFSLVPGLRWSDGAPLTADDSVYSYEVAKSLFPAYRPDLINSTYSYKALDNQTVEWRGFPGYQAGAYFTNFFTPLPRHAWKDIKPEELSTTPVSSQTPLGWGPYVVDEWVSGDHITLHKNPAYFRLSEGLPHFDKLVYRFVASGKDALDALLAGECDIADETTYLDTLGSQLTGLQSSGRLKLYVQQHTAWEQGLFGILPIDPKQASFFNVKEVRQAVAYCTDRQAMAEGSIFGDKAVSNSYLPPDNPLYNPEVAQYAFDPQKGAQLLTSAGWIDADNDPATPRIAQGVQGVPGGTKFEINYLTSKDEDRQADAKILKDSLAKCGIQVNLELNDWTEILSSGPEGPVFGRHFNMAQFAWVSSIFPSCSLFESSEIPGPYPDFAKGWGGSNAGGYQNPAFDQACQQASTSLVDNPEYKDAQRKAQAIFAEDLPVLPLYFHARVAASRPDLCGMNVDDSNGNMLWNLEVLDDAEGCPQS